jgi:hypothetical protein
MKFAAAIEGDKSPLSGAPPRWPLLRQDSLQRACGPRWPRAGHPVVAWQGCLEQESAMTQNIEVEGSHSGLGHNPVVLYAIADRLALPEGKWWSFDRSGIRSLLYPDPQRRDDGCAVAL